MAILPNRRRFLVLFRPGDEMKWKEDLYTPEPKFSSDAGVRTSEQWDDLLSFLSA